MKWSGLLINWLKEADLRMWSVQKVFVFRSISYVDHMSEDVQFWDKFTEIFDQGNTKYFRDGTFRMVYTESVNKIRLITHIRLGIIVLDLLCVNGTLSIYSYSNLNTSITYFH